MAVALAAVAGASSTFGNKRVRVFDLTFSGNYTTNGETITNSQLGLRKIQWVLPSGQVAAAATPTTANPIGAIISADGTSVAIRLYELGGTGLAGDPLAEKTTAEAYITGQTVRVVFMGY